MTKLKLQVTSTKTSERTRTNKIYVEKTYDERTPNLGEDKT
jgi:hypothetical protein